MSFPDFSTSNTSVQWRRFCHLLWHDEQIGVWLDVSRMKINSSDFQCLKPLFSKAFVAMDELVNGSIANNDENRQVGHYWLRSPSLAPDSNITDLINSEVSEIEKFGKSVLKKEIISQSNIPFTDVVWIGIGGSALGPLLLVQSLKNKSSLNFHFLDNVDPTGMYKQLNQIKDRLSSTLFVVVSKSGGTPEPQIAMDHARNYMEQNALSWNKSAVAITMKNSKLDKLAQDENWLKRFELPDWVGGRTSITGAVGLLPGTLIGIDIRDFLLGASTMDLHTRVHDISSNPAALLAASWFVAGSGKGLRDMVILPYRDSLDVFSRYLQQLIMESLGKKIDRKGNIVNQGLSVFGNKGSTDQHAYVQQLRDGIDNFFVTFIEVLEHSFRAPKLNNKSASDYLSGFLQGTRSALTEGDRQSINITIKSLDAKSLGALIALFERAVGLYGELINVNSYHQPGVEAGKKAAAKILDIQFKLEDKLSAGESFSLSELSKSIDIDSTESIYMIIRNLAFNSNEYNIQGSWSKPESLIIKKVTI